MRRGWFLSTLSHALLACALGLPVQGLAGRGALSGPREACLPEVLSRAVLCTCQLSSCLRGHPICDTRQRRCNSSVVFPVHPATPREGCVSLMPLTFTRKEAVVQTGTFPASGHPGVTVLSASPRQPRQRSALTQVTLLPPASPAQGQHGLLVAVHQAPGQALAGRLR